MESTQNQHEIRRFLNEKIRALRDLSDQSYHLASQIKKMASRLNNHENRGYNQGESSARSLSGSFQGTIPGSTFDSCLGFGGEARRPTAKIIPFPVQNTVPVPDKTITRSAGFKEFRSSVFPFLMPISGMPEQKLLESIPDFRPQLQRDGLILLSWDKRNTEMGERYTAYWVTSSGTWRYYASDSLDRTNFAFAQPVRKSYAAEDGIEFHGQRPPSYIVHVAPEFMMNYRDTEDFRPEHIKILKKLGIMNNFEYKYILTRERKKKQPF
jgi:hypothetical protein